MDEILKASKNLLFVIVLLLFLVGCSSFDTKSTAQVFAYSPPQVTSVIVDQDRITLTIKSDMYYPDHEDFNYFVVLSGPRGTDFASVIDNAGMGSLSSLKQIPNYLTNTDKPTSSGNYLNPVTVSIQIMENFDRLEDYDFAVIAYGYNESYGRLYENNGWLYSKVSQSYSIHIPIFEDITVEEGQALVIDGNGWKVSSDLVEKKNSVDFIFSTNIDNKELNVMSARGTVGISPFVDFEEMVAFPKTNYVDGKDIDNFFVIIPKHVYALKNIDADTYAHLKVNTITAKSTTFQLVYSTAPGKRSF